jgi:hypothetical protein
MNTNPEKRLAIPSEKVYSSDRSVYKQGSILKRLEALFLANIGKVLTRDQIQSAARHPSTGVDPENWHQRLSELRTDLGYTILSSRDWNQLKTEEYLLASIEKRAIAGKRVRPTPACWKSVIERAGNKCEWTQDGQHCGLMHGELDHIGGGTVKLTPDHMTPHSINPNTDPANSRQWQALCGRHQVMKKNFWDETTGKINVLAILQAASTSQKKVALQFLLDYFGKQD